MDSVAVMHARLEKGLRWLLWCKYALAFSCSGICALLLHFSLADDEVLYLLCLSLFALLTFVTALILLLVNFKRLQGLSRMPAALCRCLSRPQLSVYVDFVITLVASVIAALQLDVSISIGALIIAGAGGMALLLDFMIARHLALTLVASEC